MSRSIKTGLYQQYLYRRERWVKAYRFHQPNQYPMLWCGHTFYSYEEYENWLKRHYLSGKYHAEVGSPDSGAPKGFNLWDEYAGPNRWWFKREAAKLMRRRAKDQIRKDLREMLYDDLWEAEND